VDTNFYALNLTARRNGFLPRQHHCFVAAIGKDGAIYFGSPRQEILRAEARRKTFLVVHHRGQILSSPAIGSDGTVFFTSLDGNLYALKPDGLNAGVCTPAA